MQEIKHKKRGFTVSVSEETVSSLRNHPILKGVYELPKEGVKKTVQAPVGVEKTEKKVKKNKVEKVEVEKSAETDSNN